MQARFNKKKAALVRVEAYQRLFNKNIKDNEIILIDNISHLKYLKTRFDKDNFVFLFRDNFWFLAKKGKLEMSEFEIKKLNNIHLDSIIFNQVIQINLQNHKYLGLGWTHPREYSHLDNKFGAWSEGQKSTLLFKSDNDKKFSVKFVYDSNVKKKNYEFFMDIVINNLNYKRVLINNESEKSFLIIIDPKNFKSKDIVIEFNFSNIKSSWEQAFKPDFRFLGIKIKSIEFQKIN